MKIKQQLLIIFGPEAVGKMTVGKLLKEKLAYSMFHDHQAIQFVKQFFETTSHNFWPLVSKIRRQIFQEIASSYTPGFIITTIWNLDEASDKEYIDSIISLFNENLWEIKFVELEASIGTRMRRNLGEDRIESKPMMADKEKSEALLLEMEDLTLNTTDGFDYAEEYVKINSTNLTALETVEMIIDHFDLQNLPENNEI